MKCYNEIDTLELSDKLKNVLNEIRKSRNFKVKEYIKNKTELLNRYMKESNLDTCVVAISGGIDSAIILGLIKEASKLEDSPIKNIYPILLPCTENEGVTNQLDATSRGVKVCKCFNIEPIEIDVHDIVNQVRINVENKLNKKPDTWAIGQLVPYCRTPILYYITSLCTANNQHAIIIGTTNFSEGGYLGYVGKASDGMVDVQLISDIYKSEVYKVAKELNIPEDVINVTPNGDMYDNRKDTDVFGASYDFVELYQEFLRKYNNNYTRFKFDYDLSNQAWEEFEKFKNNLEHLHNYNKHKYLCGSPAIHLDLWNSNVPNGWNNRRWS